MQYLHPINAAKPRKAVHREGMVKYIEGRYAHLAGGPGGKASWWRSFPPFCRYRQDCPEAPPVADEAREQSRQCPDWRPCQGPGIGAILSIVTERGKRTPPGGLPSWTSRQVRASALSGLRRPHALLPQVRPYAPTDLNVALSLRRSSFAH